MPTHRGPVDSCVDHTITDGEYCIDCGWSLLDGGQEDDDDFDLKWRVVAAWAGLLVGGLAFGFGQLTMAAREGRAGPFSAALRKLATPDPNDPHQVPIGITLAYWGIRGGSLMAIGCIFLLLTLPVVKRRRYLGWVRCPGRGEIIEIEAKRRLSAGKVFQAVPLDEPLAADEQLPFGVPYRASNVSIQQVWVFDQVVAGRLEAHASLTDQPWVLFAGLEGLAGGGYTVIGMGLR